MKRGSREAFCRASLCEMDKSLEMMIGKRNIVSWVGLGNGPSVVEVPRVNNNVTVRVRYPSCFQGPSGITRHIILLAQSWRAVNECTSSPDESWPSDEELTDIGSDSTMDREYLPVKDPNDPPE